MAFVICTAVSEGEGGKTEKILINLDKVVSILEQKEKSISFFDFADCTIKTKESIDEICKNTFNFE